MRYVLLLTIVSLALIGCKLTASQARDELVDKLSKYDAEIAMVQGKIAELAEEGVATEELTQLLASVQVLLAERDNLREGLAELPEGVTWTQLILSLVATLAGGPILTRLLPDKLFLTGGPTPA